MIRVKFLACVINVSLLQNVLTCSLTPHPLQVPMQWVVVAVSQGVMRQKRQTCYLHLRPQLMSGALRLLPPVPSWSALEQLYTYLFSFCQLNYIYIYIYIYIYMHITSQYSRHFQFFISFFPYNILHKLI